MKPLNEFQAMVLHLKRQGVANTAAVYEQLINSGVKTTLNAVRSAWRACYRYETQEFLRGERIVHRYRGPGVFSHYSSQPDECFVSFDAGPMMGGQEAERVTASMVFRPAPVIVNPTGNWGRYSEYLAKVGTMSGTVILIKGAPKYLTVGQHIEYAEVFELRGCSKAMAPRWQGGVVWKIEDNRIFLVRM